MINTQAFCDMRAGEELIYRTYRALSQGRDGLILS